MQCVAELCGGLDRVVMGRGPVTDCQYPVTPSHHPPALPSHTLSRSLCTLSTLDISEHNREQRIREGESGQDEEKGETWLVASAQNLVTAAQ